MTFVRISTKLASAVALATIVMAGCQTPDSAQPDDAAQTSMTSGDQLLLASTKVGLPPQGVTAADLPDPESGGARILQTYCTTCHALPTPLMHSATDWPVVVRRMWLRMDHLDPQYPIPVPELGDRIALLDYLTANALKVAATTLPEGPGREEFTTTCNRCHELPDPAQHSPQDWFVVVRRMNQHMLDILGQELPADEVEQIVRYLGQTGM